MASEIFRMLNVRPPRTARLTTVDDLIGLPPLLAVLGDHAARRDLTLEHVATATTQADDPSTPFLNEAGRWPLSLRGAPTPPSARRPSSPCP